MEVAMQQKNIVKLCAAALRAYPSYSSSKKLQSSHAHELIAAFFGYNSRNAMLADTKYPIHNLDQADYVILPPYNEKCSTILKQRLSSLGIYRIDIHDVNNVASNVLSEQNIAHYSQPLEDIARIHVERRLREQLSPYNVDIYQINVITEVVDFCIRECESAFVLSVDCVSDKGTHTQHLNTMIVTFPRVAGYVGYKAPNVQEMKNMNADDLRQRVNKTKSLPAWPYPSGTLVMRRDTKAIGIVLKSKEGVVTIIQDTSYEATLAKEEVFPLAEQSIDFIPLRLVMPYGKYICADDSEVLYNRDYRPLWKKLSDGTVTPINSNLYIQHYKQEYFFEGDNKPSWGNPDTIRKIGMLELKKWGVENKRPQILDLLSQAIAAENADILRQIPTY
jgi:hypothetical protein